MKTSGCIKIEIQDNGLSIVLKEIVRDIQWDDINELNAYKTDLLTYDEICLDIVLSETIITITEETKGWKEMLEKLNEKFPLIDKDWYFKIMNPAFESNFNTLYKRS